MTLRNLLQSFIDAAERKDQKKLDELNGQFNNLVLTSVQGYNEYDNLRQSCLLCLKFPGTYEWCLNDARERFDRIYAEHVGRV